MNVREKNPEISKVFDLRNKQDTELSSTEMKKTRGWGNRNREVEFEET